VTADSMFLEHMTVVRYTKEICKEDVISHAVH